MMTEKIKPTTTNQAIKLVNDSFDTLIDLADRINQALKHEIMRELEAERKHVRGVVNIANKTTWAKAMVLENVLQGATKPKYTMAELYGIRPSCVHCVIIGAAFADRINDLKLDRTNIDHARKMM